MESKIIYTTSKNPSLYTCIISVYNASLPSPQTALPPKPPTYYIPHFSLPPYLLTITYPPLPLHAPSQNIPSFPLTSVLEAPKLKKAVEFKTKAIRILKEVQTLSLHYNLINRLHFPSLKKKKKKKKKKCLFNKRLMNIFPFQ